MSANLTVALTLQTRIESRCTAFGDSSVAVRLGKKRGWWDTLEA